MNPGSHDRDLLVRYLIGSMSDEERDGVGTRLFVDEAFAEAIDEVETDLIDEYASGRLSSADAKAVRIRLLNSERQQERLAVARAFARANRHPDHSTGRLLCAAAVFLLFAAGLWYHSRGMVPAAAPVVEVNGATAIPAVPQPPAPVFAALLTSGGLRDGGIQEVTLPDHADRLRFDLELPDNLPQAKYSVLLTGSRTTVLDEHDLASHLEGETPLLSIVIPHSVLQPGSYVAYVTSSGQRRQVYRFRIR